MEIRDINKVLDAKGREKMLNMYREHVPCRLPLIEALLAKELSFAEYLEGPIEEFVFGGRKPVVILLGEDDGNARGPARFEGARDLIHFWADCVFLNASSTGDPVPYAAVVQTAIEGLRRRIVFVETVQEQLVAWLALCHGCKLPVIVSSPERPDAPDVEWAGASVENRRSDKIVKIIRNAAKPRQNNEIPGDDGVAG